MTMMEKQMDILLRVVCAEDAESKAEALKELRAMSKTVYGEAAPKIDTNAAPTEDEVRDCAEALIFEIGVPASLKGFDALVESVTLCAMDKTYIEQITKRLYPDVAKRIGTTPSRVERAMRHAIEVAWNRCDIESLSRYFGNSISIDKGKPTNSEFIARMAKEVSRRVKG